MEPWALGFAILGVAGGIARWLLGYHSKTQREIQTLKSSHLASVVAALEKALADHSAKLRELSNRLNLIEQDLKLTILKLEDLKGDLKETNLSLKEFQKRIEEKQDKFASQNMQLSEELLLVRGRIGNKSPK